MPFERGDGKQFPRSCFELIIVGRWAARSLRSARHPRGEVAARAWRGWIGVGGSPTNVVFVTLGPSHSGRHIRSVTFGSSVCILDRHRETELSCGLGRLGFLARDEFGSRDGAEFGQESDVVGAAFDGSGLDAIRAVADAV